MTSPPDGLAVVIVTYESAAHVGATLRALAGQLREDDELLVIDNASTDATADEVEAAAPRARLIGLDENVGFAPACNLAAERTQAPLLLFLNPDAVPAPGCLDQLRSAASLQPDWGAWQALVTLPGGERVNTSGGLLHYLGFGWTGQPGEPVEQVGERPREIAFASGAALAVRRRAWQELGGFDRDYFMYGEDVDLALRLRLRGWGVGVTPGARVEHDYEFEKGTRKWFLLERNRWRTLLVDYPAGLLVPLLPPLLLLELALLAVAARGGWLRAKLRAQARTLGSLPSLLARRRQVQRGRTAGARELAVWLQAELDSPYLPMPGWLRPLSWAQELYWRALRRPLLGRSRSRAPD
jgi:GT2 family glycosyltransferase